MRLSPFVLLGLLALLALLLWSRPAHAASSYDNCTGFINSVPTVISTPGTWCLKQDVTTALSSGDAVTIAADDVTLDCNDFRLDGLAAGLTTTTIGVFASNRTGATVRHCNIRGFYKGVLLQGTGGRHRVEDDHLDQNAFIGADVAGDGSVVRNNLITDTGGSISSGNAFGIQVHGAVDILDNTIHGMVSTVASNGFVMGILIDQNSNAAAIGNHVDGLAADGSGEQDGLEVGPNTRAAIRRNEVASNGTTNGNGFACGDGKVRLRENIARGFVLANNSCGDAGENDFGP